MTKDELSLAIASFIEPLDTLPNPDECDYADMEEFDAKCWLASYRMSPVTLMHVPEWVPRSMVDDAEMTVMLWKKLLLVDRDYEIEAAMQRMARQNPDKKKHIEQLQQAVAEAFYAAFVKGVSR